MTEVSDFLASSTGAKHPAFKFSTVGDTVRGTICEPPVVVETPNLNDGRPEKKLVLSVKSEDVAAVAAAAEAAGIENADPGVWAVWVRKGFMAKAVNDAIEGGGADGIAEGGTIAIKYSENRDTGKPQPAKVYVAKYTPPAPSSVSVDDLL